MRWKKIQKYNYKAVPFEISFSLNLGCKDTNKRLKNVTIVIKILTTNFLTAINSNLTRNIHLKKGAFYIYVKL